MIQNIIMLVVVFPLATSIARLLFGPRPIPGVPYNHTLFWLPFGSLLSLGIHFFITGEVFDWLFLECLRWKSPIIQLFIPSFSLHKSTVVITDLHEIEDIVTRRSEEIDRADLMHGFFALLVPGATIGMKTGPGFKQQRRLWNCIFAPSFMGDVIAPSLYHSVHRMIHVWQTRSRRAPGFAFEIDHDLRQTALDGMWRMIMGTELELMSAMEEHASTAVVSLDRKSSKVTFKGYPSYPQLFKALATMFICLDWVVTGFSLPVYRWVFENTMILPSARKTVNKGLQEIVDDTRGQIANGNGPGRRCALREVLQKDTLLQGKSGIAATDNALKDEMIELLITGHETTASSTGWALKYLTDHPELQLKLRQSLLTAFPNSADCYGLPSSTDILHADLPYLDAVIAETLRVSNTGPVSFRQAQRDCKVLGQDIPRGTPIILVTAGPSHHIHADPEHQVPHHVRSATSQAKAHRNGISQWDTTAVPLSIFSPERWLDTDSAKFNKHAGPSLPFSAGPRGCFGKKIALLEMRIMLVLILLSFDLPRLPPSLSKYTARDSLTRRPTCCYIAPKSINTSTMQGSEKA